MPENERYRTTVAALSAGQVVAWAALFYTFTSFVLPMRRDFGWSEPATMGAYTLGLAMWGAGSYAVGAAIDAGRGRWVLTLGAVVGGLGFMVWSRIDGLASLYLAWTLLGAAMAMLLYDPAFALLTRRYPGRYREGITTLTLVGGFASTVSLPATAWLIGNLGWRGALATLGAVMLFGVAPLHAWALQGAGRVIAPPPTADDAGAADATLREALRGRAFWLLALAFTLYHVVAAALWAHLMPAFAAKGWSESRALGVVVWMGPAQVLGRVGFLAFGRGLSLRTLGIGVLAAAPVALACFALGQSWAALFTFGIVFGVANGLVTIVRGNLVPAYFGRGHVGRIGGALTSLTLFARAAAPLAAAALLAPLGGYRGVLLGLAAIGVAAVIAFALAGPPTANTARGLGTP